MGKFMSSTGLSEEQGAKFAILPGDPGRCETIAKFLESPRFVASNREFTTWEGKIDGVRVLVVSTGIGGPSASIAVEELTQIGVEYFIRIGTTGGMQMHIGAGDVIIPSGAIRQEGTSKEYVPVEFPAVPDFELTRELVDAAKAPMKYNYHVGVVQSKDSFMGQHAPATMPASQELLYKYNAWIAANCLCSEMECAAVFTVAQIRRVKAAAILLCIWNKEREKAGMPAEVVRDHTDAIRIVMQAIRSVINKEGFNRRK
ncbi:nucleoside phosphorylase [Oscillospiraceae bacterium MB08-C2-2]|nr:nucleoside phosphorylase [Oscillospiraceae bacterium MB08-C2-2]